MHKWQTGIFDKLPGFLFSLGRDGENFGRVEIEAIFVDGNNTSSRAGEQEAQQV